MRISALSKMAGDHVQPILPPNPTNFTGCSQSLSSNLITTSSVVLLPTHIKHYKTTAPTDMRKHQLEISQKKKKAKVAKKQRRVDVKSWGNDITQRDYRKNNPQCAQSSRASCAYWSERRFNDMQTCCIWFLEVNFRCLFCVIYFPLDRKQVRKGTDAFC